MATSPRSSDKHEDKNSTELIQHATRASEQAVRRAAEQSTRLNEAAVGVGDRAVRASAEMI